MNFVERILSYGFERIIHDWAKNQIFNTNNGWMGLTIYHPLERFIKGDKEVLLSLERFGCTDLIIHSDGKREEVKVNEKEIRISIGGNIVYHNRHGVMPPKEIEEQLNELING